VVSEIERAVARHTGSSFVNRDSALLGGGCINQASSITGECGRKYFLKKNAPSFLPFFQAEAQALEEIKATQTINTPEVIGHGTEDGQAFLILEFIAEGSSNPQSQSTLGRLLARMHKMTQTYFGWSVDNCIGATPQPNPRSQEWPTFYRDHRLAHQLTLAQRKGKSFDGADELLRMIPEFFSDYSPQPSLLHGDLWGGNASCDLEGTPFIFDPASYYGDREADLAFTYMFGGFSSAFYQAYEKEFPVDKGFQVRKTLYNLYHELNHYNLFGGGYASSAQSSIRSLLNHR